jgi:hypothetical protein
MERATTSLEEMVARHPDCAMPHAVLNGDQRRIAVRPIYARPAGSICALDRGNIGRSDFTAIGPVHYGLGFFVGYYRVRLLGAIAAPALSITPVARGSATIAICVCCPTTAAA